VELGQLLHGAGNLIRVGPDEVGQIGGNEGRSVGEGHNGGSEAHEEVVVGTLAGAGRSEAG